MSLVTTITILRWTSVGISIFNLNWRILIHCDYPVDQADDDFEMLGQGFDEPAEDVRFADTYGRPIHFSAGQRGDWLTVDEEAPPDPAFADPFVIDGK